MTLKDTNASYQTDENEALGLGETPGVHHRDRKTSTRAGVTKREHTLSHTFVSFGSFDFWKKKKKNPQSCSWPDDVIVIGNLVLGFGRNRIFETWFTFYLLALLIGD